jgi:N-acyl-L-homoserine lactone synthetase
MIDLVLPEARFGFAGALMQMHHDRKQVFVDRFGWRLPALGSWLEVDEFDNDFAVYLLARSDDGRHQGSVRLLPSTRPHMLQTLFANLCRDGAPVGEDVWEISRLVTNPTDAMGTSMLKVHRMLALALLEFAVNNGITRYTLVAEAGRVPALLSVGWTVVPLGLPTLCEGEQLQALQIEVESDSLATMRQRLRIEEPVLRIVQPQRNVA